MIHNWSLACRESHLKGWIISCTLANQQIHGIMALRTSRRCRRLAACASSTGWQKCEWSDSLPLTVGIWTVRNSVGSCRRSIRLVLNFHLPKLTCQLLTFTALETCSTESCICCIRSPHSTPSGGYFVHACPPRSCDHEEGMAAMLFC